MVCMVSLVTLAEVYMIIAFMLKRSTEQKRFCQYCDFWYTEYLLHLLFEWWLDLILVLFHLHFSSVYLLTLLVSFQAAQIYRSGRFLIWRCSPSVSHAYKQVSSWETGSTLRTGRQQCVNVVSSCTVDTEVYTCTNHLL